MVRVRMMLAADCPRAFANMSADLCGVFCPDLLSNRPKARTDLGALPCRFVPLDGRADQGIARPRAVHGCRSESTDTPGAREALTLSIMAKARLGARDVNRLRDHAVAHAKELLEVEPWKAPSENAQHAPERTNPNR